LSTVPAVTITMHPSPDAVRLRLAFELFEAGVALERQRLRRDHPDEEESEIEARLAAWLRRAGEPGDGYGRRIPWPKRP